MFDGLMPAMVTPFDEQGGLDLGEVEAVLENAGGLDPAKAR
jgi:dihydrodipicolinate synthase/N-acetylneuraminate lyase